MRCLIFFILLSAIPNIALADSLNVYSFRKAELIRPLIAQFEHQTGITVNLVSGKADQLIKRLAEDGNDSRADVLLTVDVARLENAKQRGLLTPIHSERLNSNVPHTLRDSDNFWFGLSIRARTLFVAKARVDKTSLTSYQDLTLAQWRGKLCIRKGMHYYNRSMVAAFIHNNGVTATKQWVDAISLNLAKRPNGGDRDQLRSLAAGYCDVAIANSYYYGMLASSPKALDRSVYEQVAILWPNQNKHGTHLNISGAAITKASKNKLQAIKFIEFLTTKAAQKTYSEINFEYPVRKDVMPSEMLRTWGEFKGDEEAISHLSNFHLQAKQLIENSNW